MKCLSIKQPWASLICCGAKDVENRSWRQKNVPGRILIHAGAKRMYSSYDELSIHEEVLMCNPVAQGVCPPIGETPVSAIIGYADVVDFVEESDSAWAQNGKGAEWKWVMANAKLFKEPIPYKGRLGLFDVPEIDENNLPEVWDFPQLQRNGKMLTIPLASSEYEVLKANLKGLTPNDEPIVFELVLTNENLSLFTDFDLNPIETEEIEFINSKTKECFKAKAADCWTYYEESYDDTEEYLTYQNYAGDDMNCANIVYKLL